MKKEEINNKQTRPIQGNHLSDDVTGTSRNIQTKLPETEYEVMSAIWRNTPPVTTTMLMNQIGNDKGWKLQTLVTLLNRLIDRGFLRSEKAGKERTYYPCIPQEEYIRFETALFVERYHENSLIQLVNAFSGSNKLSAEEIKELSEWLKEQEGK
ncbi:BlaI/MecI/CopY family transcriptional regulator [Lachnospiraceae bacterium MD1]|uniref:BlaI/MecI/CopY family transcriptional regulator n=1 Tax=Variimorphobacter saccharofermentans TaxID=2755051 RepID=A0A839JVF6_9FIRM|nr:BlaI/MecI/CopY family transcriptional regulator [Variimorphobacter saccharofermentans]MBB2181460.1 BlaI/MecI/CopY family transcriptional regulator [Variimorphobacter saccharofermentans]